MLLIGVTFSLRLVRRGGTGILVAGGLITGFAFYILSDVIFALGLSGRLPAGTGGLDARRESRSFWA